MVVPTGKTRMRSNIAQSKGVHLPSAMKVPFFKHSPPKCDKGSHVSQKPNICHPFFLVLIFRPSWTPCPSPFLHRFIARRRLDPTRVKKKLSRVGYGDDVGLT